MKSAFKFSQASTRNGLDEADVRFLRNCRRDGRGSAFAWTALAAVRAVVWYRENDWPQLVVSLAGVAASVYFIYLIKSL